MAEVFDSSDAGYFANTRQKPKIPVKVNSDHALVKGKKLRFCFPLIGNSARCILTGRRLTLSGTEWRKDGLYFNGSAYARIDGFSFNAGRCTLVAVYKTDPGDTDGGGLVQVAKDTSGAEMVRLTDQTNLSPDKIRGQARNSSNTANAWDAPHTGFNTSSFAAVSYDGDNNDLNLITSAGFKESQANVGNPGNFTIASAEINIGRWRNNTTYIQDYEGTIETVYVFEEVFSDPELLRFRSSPWQILEPKEDLFNFAEQGAGNTLNAESGGYVYSGTDLDLTVQRLFSADSGGYAYSGADVSLTVISGNELAADSGGYTYSGTDIGLIANRIIVSDSGGYSYSGSDVDLFTGSAIDAESGLYTYTGSDVAFIRLSVLDALSGTYTYNGTNVTLDAAGALWTIQDDVATTWTAQSVVATTWIIQ